MIKIRTIRPPDWPAIMAIQSECYHQLEPEPLEVMSNKAELAPACCWVAERQGRVLGYLLCHPWRAHCPPPLSQPLQPLTDHEEFYLHDVLDQINQQLSAQLTAEDVVNKRLDLRMTEIRLQATTHSLVWMDAATTAATIYHQLRILRTTQDGLVRDTGTGALRTL